MKRNLIDDVEIIEPPIEEITKHGGGWKKIGATGCGCSLLLLIFLIIGLKLAMGPGPQTLNKLPDNFPKDIPIYDEKNSDSITYLSGRYKNRTIEVAAFFPKIILAPLILEKNNNQNQDSWQSRLQKIWQVIATPVGDGRDVIRVTWNNVDTSQDYLIYYYQNELKKNRYHIDIKSEGQGIKQFSFSRENGISGTLYTEIGPNKIGTKTVILTVNLPPTPPQAE